LLVIACIAIIIIMQLMLKKVAPKTKITIKAFAMIAILALVWLFAPEGRLGFKLIISALVITSVVKDFVSFQKINKPNI
jgi:hypothetical protein